MQESLLQSEYKLFRTLSVSNLITYIHILISTFGSLKISPLPPNSTFSLSLANNFVESRRGLLTSAQRIASEDKYMPLVNQVQNIILNRIHLFSKDPHEKQNFTNLEISIFGPVISNLTYILAKHNKIT